jgi:hypothetical protein
LNEEFLPPESTEDRSLTRVARAAAVRDEPTKLAVKTVRFEEARAPGGIQTNHNGRFVTGLLTARPVAMALLWGIGVFVWLLALRPEEWSKVFYCGSRPVD